MCGIAGYHGTSPPDESVVQACLRLMARRGPDARGVVRELAPSGATAVLLHSRLAIIDRSERANQPMRRGDSILTLNGQVYNYRELAKSLLSHGHSLSTESDTEVLLEHLNMHGLNGLDDCEGMWAFAWYRADGRLMLCRDRFGEKPLYVHRTVDGWYWGSEIKFIRALARRAFGPDMDHVRLYLSHGYKAVCGRGRTFWTGIRELPAATALTIRPDLVAHSHRYWNPSFEADEAMTMDDAVSGVGERLRNSMNLRLRADRPIAFCMSGGVDSNSLIGLTRKHSGILPHGFTIASRDLRYDEAGDASNAAKEMGIRHSLVNPNPAEFIDGMSTLSRQHDAPVLTISYYLHWVLMRAVAEAGYQVVISGTGADELLTGYYDHHNLWLHAMSNDPESEAHMAAWSRHIAPLVRNASLRNPRLYFDQPTGSPVLQSEQRLAQDYLIKPVAHAALDGHYDARPLRNRMLNELFLQVVPAILHEDDLNAMYYSVENRSPFLDRRLAEFCFRIPSRHLMHDAYTKYPLRAAMRGVVPDAVLWNRKKVGFNGSVRELIDTNAPAIASTILDSPAVFQLVRRDAVERLLRQESHSDAENKLLFSIISAQAFLNAAQDN